MITSILLTGIFPFDCHTLVVTLVPPNLISFDRPSGALGHAPVPCRKLLPLSMSTKFSRPARPTPYH